MNLQDSFSSTWLNICTYKLNVGIWGSGAILSCKGGYPLCPCGFVNLPSDILKFLLDLDSCLLTKNNKSLIASSIFTEIHSYFTNTGLNLKGSSASTCCAADSTPAKLQEKVHLFKLIYAHYFLLINHHYDHYTLLYMTHNSMFIHECLWSLLFSPGM